MLLVPTLIDAWRLPSGVWACIVRRRPFVVGDGRALILVPDRTEVR